MRGVARGLAEKGPHVAPREPSFARKASMMSGRARAEP